MMAGDLTPTKINGPRVRKGRLSHAGRSVGVPLREAAGGGHRTKPVDRDEEYGISQEEFVKVSETLHNETIIINSKMGTLGNA